MTNAHWHNSAAQIGEYAFEYSLPPHPGEDRDLTRLISYVVALRKIKTQGRIKSLTDDLCAGWIEGYKKAEKYGYKNPDAPRNRDRQAEIRESNRQIARRATNENL